MYASIHTSKNNESGDGVGVSDGTHDTAYLLVTDNS